MRSRALALVGVFLFAALGVPLGAGAVDHVVGYPRCDLGGQAADYVWWAGDERITVTEEPEFEWEGVVHLANEVDCAAAVECLSKRPAMSGRAATFIGSDAVGTNGPDLMIGSVADDRLNGRRGADTLCGESGNDVLLGGIGNDRLIGGSGDDELRGGPSPDVVDGGDGNDSLFGGAGIDNLRGQAGRDSLSGGAGADQLKGGQARDVCFGGPDEDVFSFCAVAAPDEVKYGSGPLEVFRVQVDPLLTESLWLFTSYVDWILSDPRSWIGDGTVGWERVGTNDPADLTIILAAPETVDDICFPLQTGGYFSCRNGDTVAINVNRWNTATDWWPASLHVYRTYVINHEVGHYLGHGHTTCPGPGELARVMQQQTKTLDGCVANGWVFPSGAPGSADAT